MKDSGTVEIDPASYDRKVEWPAERKRGPRPRGPYAYKRKTLSTRITAETRKRLDMAAEASGRSLSQEIELRLEQSFLIDRLGIEIGDFDVTPEKVG